MRISQKLFAAGALAALALLSPGPGRTRMIDRDPVPGTPLRRFYTPVVESVLGPSGGRVYARVSDRTFNFSRSQLRFWWTRAPGDSRWTVLNGQPSPYAPWVLAPDPARPDTVYAVDPQGVILRSTDAGTTWETRSQAPGQSAGQLLVVGNDLLLEGDFRCFPCRSHDGGKTWEDDDRPPASNLVAAPGDPWIVYSFWERGILRSPDGARSFADISPAPAEGAGALVVAPTDADTVYALAVPPIIPGQGDGFLSRTTDGGASWTRLSPPMPGLAWSGVAVDPASARHVVILGGPLDGSAPSHLFESLDGGGSWIRHEGAVSATSLRFADAAIEAFGGRGLFTTADAGDTWAPADQGLLTDGDLELAGAANGDLYLTAGESGALWRSRNRGRDWELRGVRRLSSLTPDPFDPEALVALDDVQPGLLWSSDGGSTWVLRDGPETSDGPPGISSLAFDPHRRDTIYVATPEDAWRSTDRGVTWSRLTAGIPSGLDCDHATCHDVRDVEEVVPDPLVPGRLYVKAQRFLDFRTDDGGLTWKRIRGPFFSGTDYPRLRPDPRIAGRLYWGVRTYSQVWVSYGAGDPPWKALLQTQDVGVLVDGVPWYTFDPQGRLFVQPKWSSATFLRRVGAVWESLRVEVPYEGDVRILGPLMALPGGGTRVFFRVPGLGLFRADLPKP